MEGGDAIARASLIHTGLTRYSPFYRAVLAGGSCM
jgi:hypothetical protein